MASGVEFQDACKDTDGAQAKMHYVSRPKVTPEEVTDIYKTWATVYDKDVGQVGWNAPTFGTKLLAETLGDRKDAKILDAASGTGLGGKMMKELGYTNIDALDACKEMLDESRKLNVYTAYIEAYLGSNTLPIDDDVYDMVITYGSFVPGHVDESCFKQLARITKPGGYIGLTMCERYFTENPEYAGNIEPHMLELQSAGVWTRVKRCIVPNYHGSYNGVQFVLQMKEGKNEILKKM